MIIMCVIVILVMHDKPAMGLTFSMSCWIGHSRTWVELESSSLMLDLYVDKDETMEIKLYE